MIHRKLALPSVDVFLADAYSAVTQQDLKMGKVGSLGHSGDGGDRAGNDERGENVGRIWETCWSWLVVSGLMRSAKERRGTQPFGGYG